MRVHVLFIPFALFAGFFLGENDAYNYPPAADAEQESQAHWPGCENGEFAVCRCNDSVTVYRTPHYRDNGDSNGD